MRNRPPRQGAACRVGYPLIRRGDVDRAEIAGKEQARHAPLRVCLIGSGAISRRVAEFLAEPPAGRIELAGIGTRRGSERGDWWPPSVRQVGSPAELAELHPDVVVEAAGRDAVAEWGSAALSVARKFIVCSASALADDELRASLRRTAGEEGSQLVVAHGALGGIQALSAASLLPLETVTHEIRKPPIAWRGTNAETLLDLSGLTSAVAFYEGSASSAAASYPANANAVIVTSLAGVGVERTRVRLVADPATGRNIHRVHAAGAFGEFSLTIANEPAASNPKTSDMTALSLVRLLQAEVEALVA